MPPSVTLPAPADHAPAYLTGTWSSPTHQATYRLPIVEACRLAAGLVDAPPSLDGSRIVGTAAPRIFHLRVAPGALQLRSRQDGLTDAAWNDALDWEDDDAWSVGTRSPRHRLTDATSTSGAGTKRAVVEWSRKSRLNMARTLATLDWAAHIEAAPAGWRPQMLTLTLPGDWQTIAPTGQDFKALFRAWLERWYRRWGQRWAGCWKLEFQRRGAPHLHLYGNAPVGPAFRKWLSQSWYETCGSDDPRHLAAGTGVDWREGIRGTDPRSVALYFLGKSIAHNYGDGKEYQHRVPELWQAPGAGPGRFWGHRGLERVEVDVELDDAQYLQLRRLVGRWSKANRRRVRAASFSRWQGWTLLHADAPGWLVQALRWHALHAGAPRPRDVDEDGVRRMVGPVGKLP